MARTDTIGTLACTSFNSLANSTSTVAASSAIRTTDSTADVVDTQVQVAITVGAITPSVSTAVVLFLYGSVDGVEPGPQGGSTERLTGDAAVTLSSNANNLVRVGLLRAVIASQQIVSEPFSVAQAFGGVVPKYWGVVIQNQTGQALASSGHSVTYDEISYG